MNIESSFPIPFSFTLLFLLVSIIIISAYPSCSLSLSLYCMSTQLLSEKAANIISQFYYNITSAKFANICIYQIKYTSCSK